MPKPIALLNFSNVRRERGVMKYIRDPSREISAMDMPFKGTDRISLQCHHELLQSPRCWPERLCISSEQESQFLDEF